MQFLLSLSFFTFVEYLFCKNYAYCYSYMQLIEVINLIAGEKRDGEITTIN